MPLTLTFSRFGSLFLLHILFLWIRNCDAYDGRWVYLSRFPSSSASSSPHFLDGNSSAPSRSPTDFCVSGVQNVRVNVTSANGQPKQRVIRFRSANALAASRPLDRKSYRDVVVSRDPRFGCASQSGQPFPNSSDVSGKLVVQVLQCYIVENASNETVCPHCCQLSTKAAVTAGYGASGYASLVKRPSPNAVPTTPPNVTALCGGYRDMSADSLKSSYDLDVVYADDVNGSLNWLFGGDVDDDSSTPASPLVVVWNRRFFPWENVFNWLLIGVLATVTMTVSAYASGVVSYRAYREKFAARVRKMIKKKAHLRDPGEGARLQNGDVNADSNEDDDESDSEKNCSTPDIITGVVAFVFISLFLLLIYFVKWIAVPIFLVIYAMASLSLFTLTRPLIDRLPFGANRLRCVTHCPSDFLRRCCSGCCNWEVREVLAAIVFLTLGWTWYFLRHDKIVILTLHNFLGFSLVYHVSHGVRVSRFQACVYPCILLLIYDVFMVFITPFMTAGGMSVMESVARGTEGDDLPLVFKIPALFPSTENQCSAREVAGLLGFGDVVLPAILASYVVLAGFVLEKPKLYIGTTLCSYPVSLVATIVSLYYMQVAQPALLYIVPIMMLAIVVTAACAGDLKTLWKFDLMMYPRKISIERLRVAIAELGDDPDGDNNEDSVRGADAGSPEEDAPSKVSEVPAKNEVDGAVVNVDEREADRGDLKDTASLIRRNVPGYGGADGTA